MRTIEIILWTLLALLILGNLGLGKVRDEQQQRIFELELEKVRLEKDIECLTRPETSLEVTPGTHSYIGKASYYSEDGCVGCREDRLMANGERFDEDAMTLAFNWLPLNTMVLVRNNATDKTVEARITDTGGFNELGRIADLSLGLKNALGCSDICEIEIYEEYK